MFLLQTTHRGRLRVHIPNCSLSLYLQVSHSFCLSFLSFLSVYISSSPVSRLSPVCRTAKCKFTAPVTFHDAFTFVLLAAVLSTCFQTRVITSGVTNLTNVLLTYARSTRRSLASKHTHAPHTHHSLFHTPQHTPHHHQNIQNTYTQHHTADRHHSTRQQTQTER